MTSAYTYPPYVLPRACEVCGCQENLTPCSGCQVLYFCMSEHKPADLKEHEEECEEVEEVRLKYD